ncbi:Isochorismatase hydrolase [Gloeophyllum trabeum ATCC 11539]|uniref:nicotinamidase n=1 Tax=Gloeophyllum trabeum (strain ATCC 11539 / FP-39264 / Madison 617) TaxID=670483 RepID=S7Q4D4_GLOTA|nr:Isochorismatase hydrolase [Gloeophyllum trabeum ATCC 11539]EPQ54338.1 Isochorismatase hydrolase [Gloeophyllum trabeum ATCC 11539]
MSALLVVDVQYDFINGSLAVKDSESILPVVHELLDDAKWDLVIASQDYHPAGHVSFASAHNLAPFQPVRLPHPITHEQPTSVEAGEILKGAAPEDTIVQMLWPDHCVQGTKGAELEEGVRVRLERLGPKAHIVRKGCHPHIDGYSAFALNHYVKFTELPRLLFSKGIHKVTIVGLATDYCVRASAIDARKFDFEVDIVRAGVRGVYSDKEETVLQELEKWGCKII